MPALPHWLNIDPLASIPRMLQGFAQGAQVGESLRNSEQRAAEHADANAKFSDELAQREANAQREYALHESIQKEKAATAARNLAGMQEYQMLVASGMPKDQALMQAGPNLFYNQSEKLPMAMHQLAVEEQSRKNAERTSKHYDATEAQAAENAAALEERRRDQDEAKMRSESAPQGMEIKTPDGKHLAWGVPGAGRSVHVLREPATELNPNQQAGVLNKALTDIDRQMRDVTEGSEEEATLKAQQQEYRDMLRGVVKGTSKSTTPQVGTIHKGHRFIGGDPSKKQSWEKVP